jgi:hypothetical protein
LRERNETPISGLPEIGIQNVPKSGKPDLGGPSARLAKHIIGTHSLRGPGSRLSRARARSAGTHGYLSELATFSVLAAFE